MSEVKAIEHPTLKVYKINRKKKISININSPYTTHTHPLSHTNLLRR